MFRKIVSGLSLGAALLGAIAVSAPAAACTNNSGQWDCVEVGGYNTTGVLGVVYAGSFTLQHWYMGTIWCNDVRATVDITIDANSDAQITITDFTGGWSTSAPICANMTFSNFDWVGYDDASDTVAGIDSTRSPSAITDPVTGEFRTFELSYSGTQICHDDLPMTFQNDGSGGSYFDFNTSISGWAGNCTIDATIAHSDIQAY